MKQPRFVAHTLAVCCLIFPRLALAEHVLCEASQASDKELPVLAADCPIGTGLWDYRQAPKLNAHYWIQCGIFDHALTPAQAKTLTQQVATAIWMKSDPKGMRCLIGPYAERQTALLELAKVRKIKQYHDAFLRELVPESQLQSQAQEATAANTQLKTKANAESERSTLPSSTISQEKQFQWQGVRYYLPEHSDPEVLFYMEHQKAWNRLSYEQALNLCQQQKMQLINEQQWAQLLASKVLEKEQWPVLLPYWGQGKKGLFVSGKVTQLRGNSLLNVLCVSQ